MRIVFPGIFAALCLYPFTDWGRFALAMPLLPGDWNRVISVAVAVLALGTLVSGFRSVTYRLYVGDLWPAWLFNRVLDHQQSRVQHMRDAAADAKKNKDRAREKDIWRTLRIYPLDPQSHPSASNPTLLGNIIAAYETYPLTRYGMDSVFYWPRIWLQLEKEKKEEIDASWSRADGALSLSLVAFAGGLSWLTVPVAGYCGLLLQHARPPLNAPLTAGLSGLGLLVVGYLIYRFSLGLHIANGETFKAVFDLNRDRLIPMSVVDLRESVGLEEKKRRRDTEKERWTDTWAYLQYLITVPTSAPPSPQLVPDPVAPPPQPKQVSSGQP
jgi:hypothetical protein